MLCIFYIFLISLFNQNQQEKNVKQVTLLSLYTVKSIFCYMRNFYYSQKTRATRQKLYTEKARSCNSCRSNATTIYVLVAVLRMYVAPGRYGDHLHCALQYNQQCMHCISEFMLVKKLQLMFIQITYKNRGYNLI